MYAEGVEKGHLQTPVHLTAVADPNYEDKYSSIVDFVNDPVVAGPHPVGSVGLADHWCGCRRSRVVSQQLDHGFDAKLGRLFEFP